MGTLTLTLPRALTSTSGDLVVVWTPVGGGGVGPGATGSAPCLPRGALSAGALPLRALPLNPGTLGSAPSLPAGALTLVAVPVYALPLNATAGAARPHRRLSLTGGMVDYTGGMYG